MVESLAADPQCSQPDTSLRGEALSVMEMNWCREGYTCPNRERYPWQWLWDSCFHAIVWAEAGDERAVRELECCFSGQLAGGFVPHMGYLSDPLRHASFWGREGWSTITQPPMYGHAIAELAARGVAVPPRLVERAVAGLTFLVDRRRRSAGGLVELVHPWESGADDSPRWDDLIGGPDVTDEQRRTRKGELLAAVRRDGVGAPIANDEFAVGSVAFTALVAFNCRELGDFVGHRALIRASAELAESLSERWDRELGTWVDDGPTASGSGRVRTLEALLGVLVDPDDDHVTAVLGSLLDPTAHGAPYGPTGVHRAEGSYRPDGYWRGPAWPQLSYLLWVAATRHGAVGVAESLATSLIAGARRSGFAEFWHPDTAAAGGAVPQSWAALAWVVEASTHCLEATPG